jgi:hypothetical protein
MQPPSDPASFADIAQTYDRVREKIRNEDALINQRLGWMLSTQGFFTIAIGAFSAVGSSSPTMRYAFIAIISFIEAAISIFSLIATRSASVTIHGTMEWWSRYREKHAIDDTYLLPPLIVPIERASTWYDARFATHGIPLTSAIVWGLIFIVFTIALAFEAG